jgi:hypothetical protein
MGERLHPSAFSTLKQVWRLLNTWHPEVRQLPGIPLCFFCFRWRTLGLPGEADSVKVCALLDRAGEPEGRRP